MSGKTSKDLKRRESKIFSKGEEEGTVGGKKLVFLNCNNRVCVSVHIRHCLCHVPLPSISLFCCSKPPFSIDPFIHNSSPVATHTHTASTLFLFAVLPYPRLLLPTSKTASQSSVVDISAVTLNLPSTPDLDARLTGESRFSPR